MTAQVFERHPYPVVICCATNARDFHALCKEYGMSIVRPRENAMVVVRDGVFCVSLRSDLPRQASAFIAGVLAHEAMHVWQWTCRRAGETLPGDETEAYMMQSMVEWLYKIVDGPVN